MHLSAWPFLSTEAACGAIARGEAVLFPTETFYGLGCDAMNPDAVGTIFSIKKRALSLPLPVIIGERKKVGSVAARVPPLAEALMDAFWPGPLSIVLPANPEVPDLLTANAGRIAVRFSPHPAALLLCRETDRALVASSANLSGRPSISRPEDIDPELLRNTAGVFTMGPEPAGGLPSTVVDVPEVPGAPYVRVLRQGAIGVQALEAAGFSVAD